VARASTHDRNLLLATIPSTACTEIGFAVAFGILLDTIVVRSVLVTALTSTSAGGCGDPASWPAHPTPPQPSSATNAPPP
jgi:RND superfamily putative drug exporter